MSHPSHRPSLRLWKAERGCSEPKLREIAEALTSELKPSVEKRGRAIVCLEGELGAGKSTFARWMLEALDIPAGKSGSPTYPLVQSHRTATGWAHHADLYRLKSEAEIFEAGIEDLVWNANLDQRGELILLEWASLWSQFYRDLHARRGFFPQWRGVDVRLKLNEKKPESERDVEISFW